MDLGLIDKVAIVTGGAAGIGKATVEILVEEGASVVVVDKNRDTIEFLKSEHWLTGKKRLFLCYDLTRDERCNQVIQDTIEKYGRLDILVNNAGGNDFLPISTTSPDQLRASLDRNFVHYYTMAHYAWPELKRTRGSIVNVGSKVALTGETFRGGTIAYASGKGAVISLTRQLATTGAYEDLGIRANCVLPGKVDTYTERVYGPNPDDVAKGRIIEGRDIPLGKRLTTPREVAYVIAFLASNKVSGHTTGEIWSPDGGYVHLDRLAHELRVV